MSDTNKDNEFPQQDDIQTDEPIEMGENVDQPFEEEDYYEEDYNEFDTDPTSADDYDAMGSDDNFQSDFQPKKKSGKLFIILIALVVLGGGAYAALTLFGGSDTTPPLQPTAEVVPPQDTQIAGFENSEGPLTPMPEFVEPPIQNQELAQAGQAQDPNNFVPPSGELAEEIEESDLPAVDDMQESFLDATEEFAVQDEVIGNTVNQNDNADVIVAPEGLGVEEQAEGMEEAIDEPMQVNQMEQSVAAEEDMVMPEQEQSAVPAAQMPDTGEANIVFKEILVALNSMGDTILDMQKTINSLDVRMNALEATEPQVVEAAVPADVVKEGDLKNIQTAIDRLETRMLELQKNQEVKAASAPAPAPVLGTAAPASATTAVPANTNAAVSPITWRLQSAQPNRAWLVKDGSSAYVPVAVGDTIPGLGRINFIGQKNGRWVVEGTQGSVSG